MPHLLCLGYGFSARFITKLAHTCGWAVSATTRSPDRFPALEADGVRAVLFSDSAAPKMWKGVTHVISSIAPSADPTISSDPALTCLQEALTHGARPRWIGYLSTIGVYGDSGGAWVDEDDPVNPGDIERLQRRVAAERAWLDQSAHLFRLAGIYGPGRSVIERLRSGVAQSVVKPGQVFCRIHVEDIAQAVMASATTPSPGRIYNVCDDEPAPPQEVTAYAAGLIGMTTPPPEIAFENATLSPMARSFYANNHRVRNDRLKSELGVKLKHPTYREGLRSCLS